MTENNKKKKKSLDTKSVEAHNRDGYNSSTLEEVKIDHEKSTKNRSHYNSDNPLGNTLDAHPSIQTCVDIGSGQGWASALMSETRKKVYAIEPSDPAMRVAKELYADGNKNIDWVSEFAEQGLRQIGFLPGDKNKQPDPVLFNSMCVLSHLDDAPVLEICSRMNNAAVGSVLSFSELWGEESHETLWNTRTKEWWTQALSSYKLTFIEHPCQKAGRFKSFTGVKEKK